MNKNWTIFWTLVFFIFFGACTSDSGSSKPSATSAVNTGDYTMSAYDGMGGLQKAVKKDAQDKLLEEGDMLNGKREGTWVTYHTRNGLIESITSYKNGIKHGLEAKIDDRGDLKERAFYVNGLLEGTRYVYYFTKVKEESNYKKGKLDGLRKVHYDTGEIQQEMNFKEGKQHGIAKYYNKEGEVTIENEYNMGEKVK